MQCINTSESSLQLGLTILVSITSGVSDNAFEMKFTLSQYVVLV